MSEFNVVFASSVIFSDGFEDGFLNWTDNDEKWATSGTSVPNGVKSGEKRAEVKGNTEPGDDVLLKNVSTIDKEGIIFQFWYRIKESLEDSDHVYVEWTPDGSNWNILRDFTSLAKSDVWELASYNLPAEADDNVNFAVRFRAHLGAASSDIFYLDDVALVGDNDNFTPIPSISLSSSPQVSSEPTPTALATPISTPTPMSSPRPSPILTPSPSFSFLLTPTPIPPPPSVLRTPTPTPKISKIQDSAISQTPTPVPSVSARTELQILLPADKFNQKLNKSSEESVASGSTEVTILPQKSDKIPKDANSFFASIFKFAAPKSFWFLGLMIAAIVISLAKLKKN